MAPGEDKTYCGYTSNIPIQKENSTTKDEKMIKIEDENTAY